MTTSDRVRVTLRVPGREPHAVSHEPCPWKGIVADHCVVEGIDCRLGLTETVAPAECPLRAGPIDQRTELVPAMEKK